MVCEAEEERAGRSGLGIEAIGCGTGVDAAAIDPDVTAFLGDERERGLRGIELEQRIIELHVDRQAVATLEREDDRLIEDVLAGLGALDQVGVTHHAWRWSVRAAGG